MRVQTNAQVLLSSLTTRHPNLPRTDHCSNPSFNRPTPHFELVATAVCALQAQHGLFALFPAGLGPCPNVALWMGGVSSKVFDKRGSAVGQLGQPLTYDFSVIAEQGVTTSSD